MIGGLALPELIIILVLFVGMLLTVGLVVFVAVRAANSNSNSEPPSHPDD